MSQTDMTISSKQQAEQDIPAAIRTAAQALVDRVMSDAPSERDIAMVTKQLGRYPRGMVAVGARCAVCGSPLAVVTRPELPDGTPFPTTCYLTSPEAVKAVSHVEASGAMAQMTEELEGSEDLQACYRAAHQQYLAFRSELAARLGDSEEHVQGISAGGMPVRVKCLHALLAQTLVMGAGINPFGDSVLEQVKDEFSPDVCRCSVRADMLE